jgi:hypothetical protein
VTGSESTRGNRDHRGHRHDGRTDGRMDGQCDTLLRVVSELRRTEVR